MDNISFDRNSATQSEKLGEMTSILSECKVAATTGYNIATKHERQLNKTLTTAEEMVRNTLLSFTSSPCYSPETTRLLQGQLLDIEQAFMHLSFAFREDLENLKGNLSKFSITLFGRTMAGDPFGTPAINFIKQKDESDISSFIYIIYYIIIKKAARMRLLYNKKKGNLCHSKVR